MMLGRRHHPDPSTYRRALVIAHRRRTDRWSALAASAIGHIKQARTNLGAPTKGDGMTEASGIPARAPIARLAEGRALIDALLPRAVVTVETDADVDDVSLPSTEARALGNAVESRRREFATGRTCAKIALARLGMTPTAIPAGARGEPVWPAGVVGSITHCRGYRGCAVARARDILTIGVDAEIHEPLPDGVLEHVATAWERRRVGHGGGVHVDRLLFSAKEAFYKAWFPLTRCPIGFEDVEAAIDGNGTFTVQLRDSRRVARSAWLAGLQGRWRVEDGFIATAVVGAAG
jgi:4'-phosphopantetheinyl transferase EntD